ncbi:hypothetical protein OV079_27330 [Nannocystis pusilla]|uniref:Uncharacterized protein n=1 Tax=Nannocystis pusilla TaxID=889268 RepID=A0A9X3ERX2_9BACT|nr:hypothetical protein [Nannocystis pusilla]MCY1009212.1 hypothetical protein [Nannocystis pusilla]
MHGVVAGRHIDAPELELLPASIVVVVRSPPLLLVGPVVVVGAPLLLLLLLLPSELDASASVCPEPGPVGPAPVGPAIVSVSGLPVSAQELARTVANRNLFMSHLLAQENTNAALWTAKITAWVREPSSRCLARDTSAATEGIASAASSRRRL